MGNGYLKLKSLAETSHPAENSAKRIPSIHIALISSILLGVVFINARLRPALTGPGGLWPTNLKCEW